jgi:hypothetical protein
MFAGCEGRPAQELAAAGVPLARAKRASAGFGTKASGFVNAAQVPSAEVVHVEYAS